MKIVTLTTGVFAQNGYLVIDEESGQCAVIDPGQESEVFLRRIDTEGVTPAIIWLTHAHLDHILGVAAVHAATGVPIVLHPDDLPLYRGIVRQAEAMGLPPVDPVPEPTKAFEPGTPVRVGKTEFEVRHTPGHSPGSVTLVGAGVAFVGDVLFAGSVGRVDLPGGDGPTLLTSITEELLSLSDETIVYSGHGPATTIGRERATNPFLTGDYPLA